MLTKTINFDSKKLGIILPYALAVVLSSAIFTVYTGKMVSVWTVATMAVCAFCFMLARYVDAHRGFGRVILLTLAIYADFVVFLRLTGSGGNSRDFVQWAFDVSVQTSYEFMYLGALLALFPVFFSLTIYYFTNVRYHMSYLTLLSLVPCVLYVKAIAEIDNTYLVIIALINLAIYINNKNATKTNNIKIIGGKSFIVSAVFFAVLLLLISSAIPKQEQAKYYDIFERYFINGNTSIALGGNYSGINEESGNADNYNENQNRQIYVLYGENVPYLKRQNFDYYNFETDKWYADEDQEDDNYNGVVLDYWSRKRSLLNLTALQSAIRRAAEYDNSIIEEYNLDWAINLPIVEEGFKNLYVQSRNFSAEYYLSTARVVSLTNTWDYRPFYVTGNNCFRIENGRHNNNTVYQLSYYDEVTARNTWFNMGAANYDNDTVDSMLWTVRRILRYANDDYADVLSEFISEYADSEYYKFCCEENNELISEKIKNLAEEITKDCQYDWQRAEALQNYFVENKYIYDIEYVAEDTSPEYFLFKSKRGTCSDFASAYVLMARAIGLNARYTEGYTYDKGPRDDICIISDKNAHAYPEVYIQNMGWTVYEPTVPSSYNSFDEAYTGSWFSKLEMDYKLIWVILTVAGILLAICLVTIAAIPFAGERLFIYRLKKADSKQSVAMVYDRIINKYAAALLPTVQGLTPYELSDAIFNLLGYSLSPLANIIERVFYAQSKAQNEDKQCAVNCYFELKQAVRAYKKENK